jgi:hypothetical protein
MKGNPHLFSPPPHRPIPRESESIARLHVRMQRRYGKAPMNSLQNLHRLPYKKVKTCMGHPRLTQAPIQV